MLLRCKNNKTYSFFCLLLHFIKLSQKI
uniref:Uncharacterized protein n=1 Tax=Rhizophora mucronata TaxID=61149 RepID=A0A2P2JXU4_RHIMU